VDFNTTAGLTLNGHTATTSCEEGSSEADLHQPAYGYQPKHGTDEVFTEKGELKETHESVMVSSSVSASQEQAEVLGRVNAAFGHRDQNFYNGYKDSRQEDCAVRLRLTSSHPDRVGSVWRSERIHVQNGFQTEFEFQISDLSKSCTLVRDASFSSKKYESCAVHGGDGFAFVIHRDEMGMYAVGEGSSQLGFGGLKKALAVEFDIWYNPEQGDVLQDHITVRANGHEGLNAGVTSALHAPITSTLADGALHLVKIAYYPYVKTDLLEFFSLRQPCYKFLKDMDRENRLGTLAVWLDDEVDPLIALPINLGIALDLEDDLSVVGFTAATGRSFAKHDLLSWRFCESSTTEDCVYEDTPAPTSAPTPAPTPAPI